MEPRISIVTLGVADLDVSRAFYTEKLGWKALPSSNDNIVFMRLNGVLLSLYSAQALAEDAGVAPRQAEGFNNSTVAYLTRSESEVDAIISNLKSLEVQIVKEPEKAFWGGYSSYFSDPDGHLWEVAFNPFIEMDEAGNIKE